MMIGINSISRAGAACLPQKGVTHMERFYIVEILNELILEREDIIRDSPEYTVINVFVEAGQPWE